MNSTREPQTWCPATNTPSDYLQVDMGSVKSVRAMATQRQGTGSFYTATYYLKYSLDNKVWNTYKENNEKKGKSRVKQVTKTYKLFCCAFSQPRSNLSCSKSGCCTTSFPGRVGENPGNEVGCCKLHEY